MAFEAMKDAAQRLGWKLSPESPGMMSVYSEVMITGAEAGVPVTLKRFAASYSFTTIGFFTPPLPAPLVITTEGVTGKVANALGMHDIEIGDPVFDKTFRLVSKDHAFVESFVTPDVKAVIEQLNAATRPALNSFKITETAVLIERSYMTNAITVEDILRDIPLVVHAVQTLRR